MLISSIRTASHQRAAANCLSMSINRFGTGARACIGRQFAQHEILLTLAAILHEYELQPRPGYKLQVSETLTLKPAGLQLRLTKRR